MCCYVRAVVLAMPCALHTARNRARVHLRKPQRTLTASLRQRRVRVGTGRCRFGCALRHVSCDQWLPRIVRVEQETFGAAVPRQPGDLSTHAVVYLSLLAHPHCVSVRLV